MGDTSHIPLDLSCTRGVTRILQPWLSILVYLAHCCRKPHIRKLTTLSLITKLQFILLVIRTPQHILWRSCYDTRPTGYTLSYILQTTHATSFETHTPCMRCKDYYQWQCSKVNLYWALPSQRQGLTPIVSKLPSIIFCEIIIIRLWTAIWSDESETPKEWQLPILVQSPWHLTNRPTPGEKTALVTGHKTLLTSTKSSIIHHEESNTQYF